MQLKVSSILNHYISLNELLITALVLTVLFVTAAPASAATTIENWANQDNWTVENVGTCNTISGTLSCNNTVIVKHNTLVYNPAFPMSIEGWLKSPDVKTQTPSYFGAVLQSVVNGNYYGSIAVANWVDERNGVFGPYWIIFDNEWQLSSKWWNPPGVKLPKPQDGQQAFKLVWTPKNTDGTQGVWATTIKNSQNKTVTYTSPTLPLPLGGVSPRLGFGRGRAIVGPLTMSGTPL